MLSLVFSHYFWITVLYFPVKPQEACTASAWQLITHFSLNSSVHFSECVCILALSPHLKGVEHGQLVLLCVVDILRLSCIKCFDENVYRIIFESLKKELAAVNFILVKSHIISPSMFPQIMIEFCPGGAVDATMLGWSLLLYSVYCQKHSSLSQGVRSSPTSELLRHISICSVMVLNLNWSSLQTPPSDGGLCGNPPALFS